MSIVLSIDDTALYTHVVQLLALIGQNPSDQPHPGCLEITDRMRSVRSEHAVVRLGVDICLPEDDEVLLSLIDQALSATARAPILCVVGACGRAGVTSTVIRLVSQYRGDHPLTIVDLSDDPLFPARLEVCAKPPRILTWEAIDSERGSALTRLGTESIAIVSAAQAPPPFHPAEWIATVQHRGPVLVDAGRCSPAIAAMIRQLDAFTYLCCRHASRAQIEAAVTRLQMDSQRIFIPARPPRNAWADRARWIRRGGDQRLVALLASGESDG
ncbi:MAG: hypothetical protein Q4P05_02695 [Actinomycetaceae bacterium]|nr:hypothetical protein [Actinomycetaceae bacterium]